MYNDICNRILLMNSHVSWVYRLFIFYKLGYLVGVNHQRMLNILVVVFWLHKNECQQRRKNLGIMSRGNLLMIWDVTSYQILDVSVYTRTVYFYVNLQLWYIWKALERITCMTCYMACLKMEIIFDGLCMNNPIDQIKCPPSSGGQN